jgi:hypothetical protein
LAAVAIKATTGSQQPSALPTILWIGLVAGTLDITDNLVFNLLRGITPKMVFQYIASGLIGSSSFQRGGASIALGVVLHYVSSRTSAVFPRSSAHP